MIRNPQLEPAAASCLEHTRSAVMSVLLLDGLVIAGSGLFLRLRGPEITLISPEEAYRWSHLILLILMFLGSALRLIGTARPVLENPRHRSRWFFWSHVGSALLGLLALPVGFAYAWAVRPRLSAVGPFWAVALVLGLLALPRLDEILGFDRPMPSRLPDAPEDAEDADPSRTSSPPQS
jgi:hypothetical protein